MLEKRQDTLGQIIEDITPVLEKYSNTEELFATYKEKSFNRLPRIPKNYRPTGRRNQGISLERLLDM